RLAVAIGHTPSVGWNFHGTCRAIFRCERMVNDFRSAQGQTERTTQKNVVISKACVAKSCELITTVSSLQTGVASAANSAGGARSARDGIEDRIVRSRTHPERSAVQMGVVCGARLIGASQHQRLPPLGGSTRINNYSHYRPLAVGTPAGCVR